MSTEKNGLLHAPLSIDFLVVGGGIAALSCAISLTRVGHRVIVLEKSDGKTNRREGGVRLPPNMTKILFHWGMKQKLQELALATQMILFSRFESGDLLGKQEWNNTLLQETQGVFMLSTHADLHRLLTEAAIAQGAQIRYNAEVVETEPEDRTVKLASGEVLTADVIIGADGEWGLCRRLILGHKDRCNPLGIAVYDTSFDTRIVLQGAPEEIQENVDIEGNMTFNAVGNGRASVGYPIHMGKEIAFHFMFPDDRTDGSWSDPPTDDLKRLIQPPCDERLLMVADQATNTVRVPALEYETLEDWVDDSEGMVLVGQAAHPFVPASMQGTPMVVEDAAVLAKLFAHISTHDQIGSFLWAFQDLRKKRCEEARSAEMNNLLWMTMQDGPEQQERDDSMRRKFRQGKNVLEAEDGSDASPEVDEIRTIFGYDCEDEADNWWVQWGLLRQRAKESTTDEQESTQSFWSRMSVQY